MKLDHEIECLTIDHVAEVCNFDIKAIRKIILIKLIFNAIKNNSNSCSPSHLEIANFCRVKKITVIKHIAELEEDGFITKQLRLTECRSCDTNVYTICMTNFSNRKYVTGD